MIKVFCPACGFEQEPTKIDNRKCQERVGEITIIGIKCHCGCESIVRIYD